MESAVDVNAREARQQKAVEGGRRINMEFGGRGQMWGVTRRDQLRTGLNEGVPDERSFARS